MGEKYIVTKFALAFKIEEIESLYH